MAFSYLRHHVRANHLTKMRNSRISMNQLYRAVILLLVGLILSAHLSFTSSSSEPSSKAKTSSPPSSSTTGMANHQGNPNSNSRDPNMRWGHGAAPDGSWEYSWKAGSVPGGPSFSYGSASARSDGGSGSGFGFSWDTGAAGSGSGSGSGQGQNHHGFGRSHYDFGQPHMGVPHFGFGQPHMHMPHYGMPFGPFPFHMGPMPPRPPTHGTDDNRGRGRRGDSAASSR